MAASNAANENWQSPNLPEGAPNVLWIPRTICDSPPNPNGTGGAQPPDGGNVSRLATVESHIKSAFLWLKMLSAAAGVAFLFLITQLLDMKKDVGGIQAASAAQAATSTAIQGSLVRIEGRLDKEATRHK